MSDPAFQEEFDLVADDISALYVGGHFQGEEKEQVERYFLRSPERQRKVQFMCELLHQVGVAPEEPAANNLEENASRDAARVAVHEKPRLWDRVRSLWTNWPLALRAATTLATVALVAAGALFIRSLTLAPTFVAVELAMTNVDRSVGADVKKLSLPSGTDELRLKLKLPTEAAAAKSYRAELRGEDVSIKELKILEQTSDSITAVVPANQLTRGTYLVELYTVNNGSEQLLRGAYLFKVE